MNYLTRAILTITSVLIFLSGTSFSRPGDGPGNGGGLGERFRDERGPHDREHHGRHFRRGKVFGHIDRLVEDLGLSKDQLEKVRAINLKYRKLHEDLRPRMRPLKRALRDELLKDPLNLKEIRTLLEKLAALEVEARFLGIKHHAELEKVLTLVQRKELRERMRHRAGRRP